MVTIDEHQISKLMHRCYQKLLISGTFGNYSFVSLIKNSYLLVINKRQYENQGYQ